MGRNQTTTSYCSDAKGSSNILHQAAMGDINAVATCLDKYGKLVWNLARKFTRTREEAEDATQEIFLEIWKCAERFDETKSSEVVFIALIARRRLIDLLRRSRIHPQISIFETEIKDSSFDFHKNYG